MSLVRDAARRAGRIAGRLPRPTRGRHAAARRPGGRIVASGIAVSATALIAAGVGVVALGGHGGHGPTPPSVAPTATEAEITAAASPAAELIHLAEWDAAGIQLDADEESAVVRVARTHVAHGHLVGMREFIREDLQAAVPRLPADDVEVGLVLVEHHFQRVTGASQ